jgi:hypothetical protein
MMTPTPLAVNWGGQPFCGWLSGPGVRGLANGLWKGVSQERLPVIRLVIEPQTGT